MRMPLLARWLAAALCFEVVLLGAGMAGEPVPGGRAVLVEKTLAGRFDSGRKWAVVIGVNEYLDPAIPKLQYSVADARLIAETLARKCGYDEQRILLIVDDQEKAHLRPLKINLQKQISGWLKNAVKGDTVLVFFSGHGFLDERGQGFLAPQDCEKSSLGLTSFRTEELRDLLHQCAATQKLLILDCCHAGSARAADIVGPSSQEIGQSFEKAEGLVTLASCRKKEFSQEWKAKRQGIFTFFLVQGLEGAADFDHNGLIDSDELYRYAVDKVPTTAQRELNAQQTPVRIIGEDVVGVFALARTSGTAAKPKPEVIANSLGMKLVMIPAGEFQMGSPPAEVNRLLTQARELGMEEEVYLQFIRSEGPQHRVKITKPFYLGIHEVTVGQFREFVTSAGYKTDAEKERKGGFGLDASTGDLNLDRAFTWRSPGFPQEDDHPVVIVSWNDAQEFCRWLSSKESRTYRLPSEAEWEYACRADTQTRFWTGEDPEALAEAANLADATGKARFPNWGLTISARDGYVFTAPVGRFKANPFGLYDMHGNVSEWCADWFAEDYYGKSSPEDPRGPAITGSRVLRGGAWNGGPQSVRSAGRSSVQPNERSCVAGFRVALTP